MQKYVILLLGNLTMNDDDLWKYITQNVKKLPQTKYHCSTNRIAKAPSKPQPQENSPSQNNNVVMKYKVQPTEDDYITRHNLKMGSFGNIGYKTLKKIKQQGVVFDAKLDLHGCYIEDAHRILIQFIENNHSLGNTKCIVVTGKDSRNREENSIKYNVPKWLTSSPLNHYILYYGYAAKHQGGNGAIIVILRGKT